MPINLTWFLCSLRNRTNLCMASSLRTAQCVTSHALRQGRPRAAPVRVWERQLGPAASSVTPPSHCRQSVAVSSGGGGVSAAPQQRPAPAPRHPHAPHGHLPTIYKVRAATRRALSQSRAAPRLLASRAVTVTLCLLLTGHLLNTDHTPHFAIRPALIIGIGLTLAWFTLCGWLLLLLTAASYLSFTFTWQSALLCPQIDVPIACLHDKFLGSMISLLHAWSDVLLQFKISHRYFKNNNQQQMLLLVIAYW